jgi:DnaK suppressor protein
VDGVREGLLAERAAAEAQLAELAADVAGLVAAADGANGDDEHDPEGATIAFERAQAQALQAGVRRRVTEIDVALRRLADGGYGECVSCGGVIAPERLAARPSATRCFTCAGR